MRFARPIWAFLLFSTGLSTAAAQFASSDTPNSPTIADSRYPARMTITAVSTEVRSGGSRKFTVTGTLQQGTEVDVLRESSRFKGWLEIKPPVGSFSWINAKYVKITDSYYGIVDDPETRDVPIMPGTFGTKEIPSQVHMRLKRGHIVVLLDDAPREQDKEKWLPIAIVPGEVRYVEEKAVQGSVAQQIPTLAMNYYRPSNASSTTGTLTGALPGYPNNGAPVHLANRRSVSYSSPTAQPNVAQQNSSSKGQWTSWGQLRRTRFTQNGQTMYALEDNGQLIMYAITQPNLTLDPYINRRISLYGSIQYGGDGAVRTNYMLVSHVAVP